MPIMIGKKKWFPSMSEAKVWPGDRSLLIVDDDAPLRMRLVRAMETRGSRFLRPKAWPRVSNLRWRIRQPTP